MRGALGVARAEAYRLVRGRGVLLAWGALALVAAARVAAARFGEARAAAERLARGARLPDVDPTQSGAGWAPLADGWRTGTTLGALLILFAASRALAADRESGVLRLAVTRSATRAGLVWGRALLAPLEAFAVLLASGLGAWAAALALYEFGPLTESGYELASAAELRSELLRAVGHAFLPLCALHAFGLCVSSFASTPARASATALFIFLGFDLFKDALGDGQFLVFASFVPSLVDQSALGEMGGIARGFSDAGYPRGVLARNLWVPPPQALLCLVLACLRLRSRPL